MPKLFIDNQSLEEIKSIFKEHYPKATVWAYGSRVKGTAHEGSDLDIVITDYGNNVQTSATDYLLLKKTIQESNIPFLVDIFELNRLPKSFQDEIKNDYIVIYP